MACPGAYQAEKDLPEPPESIHAKTGTAVHAVCEGSLAHNRAPESYVGETINGVVIAAEMAASARVYVDEVRRLREAVDGALYVERLTHCGGVAPGLLYGTADALIVAPFGECIVVDYKNGAGHVVEADAVQLRLYALAALEFDPATVRTVVVQPNAPHPDGPIRSHTYTAEELKAWRADVRAFIKAAQEPDAPRKAGDHCRWCKAGPTCPARRALVLDTAQTDFDAVDGELISPPKPADLSQDDLARILRAADILDAWLKEVRSYAQREAQHGRPPTGFKLVEGRRGARAWADEKVVSDICDLEGVDAYTRKLKTPPQLEKEIGKARFANLAGYVVQPSGRPELVPETDKRPALTCSAEADFAEPYEEGAA